MSMLDETREIVVVIDSLRSISATPAREGGNIVLSLADPHTVAIVEMNQKELAELIDGLTKLKVPE